MRNKRDKIALITSFGSPEDSGSSNNNTYKESLTRKVESLIKDTYPWLGDFVLTLVETDADNDFAFGTARLSDYSGGFSVEFPVFYLEGKLMDIPSFVLAERDVSFPFTEVFYKVITSTINSDDNIAMVKEKVDMSDTLKGVMQDDGGGTTTGLLKMSSLSKILSNLPRNALKQYAKTASASFPELTREFYSAIKLSRFKGNLYQAACNLKDEDKTAELNTKNPSPMLSIVTPVFRSEAEYTERDETVDYVEQITNKAFVLPEANTKVNLTPIPDAMDLVKSLNENFELIAPGELFEVVRSRCTKRSWEPQAIICLSNNEDYWLVPEASPKMDPSYGGASLLSNNVAHGSDGYGSNSKEMAIRRHFSVNDLGGVFAFDYNYRYGHDFKDLIGKKVQDRVVYLPESKEKYGYFSDILDTPLNIKHNLVSNLQNERITRLPIRTEGNKVALIPIELSYRMKDAEDYRVEYSTVDKGGKFIQNYFAKRTSDTARGDSDLEKLPMIKLVSDPITGEIETAYFHKEAISWNTRRMYSEGGSQKSYVIFGFNGSKTYDPARFDLYGSDSNTTTLRPSSKESEDRRIVFATMDKNAESLAENLIRKIYDEKRLNPDFILNTLGVKPDTGSLDLGIPYMELDIKADSSIETILPNFGSEGATVLRVNYDEADDMLIALGSSGVEPDDLKTIDKDVKEACSNAIVRGLPYNATITKLAYAVSPTPQGQAQGLDSDMILQQMFTILNGVQKEQESIKNEVGGRSKLIDKQFDLMDKKLSGIDELKTQLAEITGAISEIAEQTEENQAGPVTAPEEGVPPEVIEEMAHTVIDPANSPMKLDDSELQILTAAANGDEAAAQQMGLDPNGHSMLIQFYNDLAAQAPQEGAPAEPTPEDIANMAKVASDPEGAVSQGGMEQGQVDQLLAALDGDVEAAKGLGLTPELLDQITQQVSAQNGPGQEDLEQLAQIVSDPEGAVSQGGMEQGQVDMLVAAVNGDPTAMEQAGLDEATVQSVQQMMSSGAAAPGGEPVPDGPAPSTEEQLMESYEKAKVMVEAYLNPDRAEELQVTPEDIGTVAIILRAPDTAKRSGIPGNVIQSVSDSYMAITGKPIYASAEKEFSSTAGSQSCNEIGSSKNVISNSKDFEQYTKPLAETSALLDIIPKVKTAKLFFQNADDFKNMLKIMGEMMMNLQVNAIKYRDMMGTTAYERLLARIKKVYDDFGTMVLQMYTLDTTSSK